MPEPQAVGARTPEVTTTIMTRLMEDNVRILRGATERAPTSTPTKSTSFADLEGSRARRRLLREVKNELERAEHELQKGLRKWTYSITLLNDDLQELLAVFTGPASTPYEGGIFYIRLSFPNSYPAAPPRVWYLTKIYHPNIDPEGIICDRVLEKQWTPAWTAETMVLTFSSLLSAPSFDYTASPEIARVYNMDIAHFERIARDWTAKYATGEIIYPGQRDDGFYNTTTAQ